MARLKQENTFKHSAITVDDFCAGEGRVLAKQYLVEGGRYILVEELQGSHICYTFFESNTLHRIEPSERYLSENGREEYHVLGDGYSSTIKIQVNAETGFESVTEQLFKDGESVRTYTRPRYYVGIKSLVDRYNDSLILDKKRAEARMDYLQRFYNADFEQKVRMLNTDFARNSTDNYVMGIEPAELFLSKEQFDDLDKDKDFRRALPQVWRCRPTTQTCQLRTYMI